MNENWLSGSCHISNQLIPQKINKNNNAVMKEHIYTVVWLVLKFHKKEL